MIPSEVDGSKFPYMLLSVTRTYNLQSSPSGNFSVGGSIAHEPIEISRGGLRGVQIKDYTVRYRFSQVNFL